MNELTLAYSPCPNDTYIFHGLAEGAVKLPFPVKVHLADVEMLNRQAQQGAFDVTKISASAVPHVLDKYWLLKSGGAIGRGCGPLITARRPASMRDLKDAVIAVPGELTTAHLLLRLEGSHRGPCVPMQFDRIMPAIASGEVDAGVIIHEGRFTYASLGLSMVLDLGEWWERETGLPLPLGTIAIRRELGRDLARMVDEKIRESLLHARSEPPALWPYIRRHAREMEPEVIRRHIDTFVNEFSVDAATEGENALRALVKAACEIQNLPVPHQTLFWE